MKRVIILLTIFLSLKADSQVIDSLQHVIIDTLSEESTSPDKKKAQVIISSGSSAVRGNSWDDRWLTHTEKGALEIGRKLLALDSAKRIYRAIVQFSINEDGSLSNLEVWCSPANALVQKECRRIAMTAPKKPPVYRNGKFVRTNIRQPIDIKVNY